MERSREEENDMHSGDLERYCSHAMDNGASGTRIISPASVVTAPWVRLKCQFGCPGYDRGYCCPPHTPTPEQTRVILDCYTRALLFHIQVAHLPEKEKRYRKFFDMLVDLEGEAFKDGYYKAFVFLAGPCLICKRCAKEENKPCLFLSRARPCMEACGIDVYQTARNNGFFIEPLRQRTDTQNEYCLLLVD